jgi:hypothetical protein
LQIWPSRAAQSALVAHSTHTPRAAQTSLALQLAAEVHACVHLPLTASQTWPVWQFVFATHSTHTLAGLQIGVSRPQSAALTHD